MTFFNLGSLTSRGPYYVDPVVIYNDVTHRFVIGCLNETKGAAGNPTNSWYDFAISTSDNPTLDTSDWTFHQFNVNDGVHAAFVAADFPKIGYNADGYVVTFNMFTNGTTYDHVSYLAIDNSGDSAGITNIPTPSGLNTNFGFAPASEHGASSGDPMWFVEDGHTGNGTAYGLSETIGNIYVIRMDSPFTSPSTTFYPVSVSTCYRESVPREPGPTTQVGGGGSANKVALMGTRFYFTALKL